MPVLLKDTLTPQPVNENATTNPGSNFTTIDGETRNTAGMTPYRVLQELRPDATEDQKDSAIQAHFKVGDIAYNTRTDTMTTFGIRVLKVKPFEKTRFMDTTYFHGGKYFHPELGLPRVGVAGDPAPYLLRNDNTITSLLLGCFLLAMFSFSFSKNLFLQQLKNFFFVPRSVAEMTETALERRFQPVTVAEPNMEDTLEILKGIAHYYENFHGVQIPEGILRQAVALSERYITDRFLPDKAIDLIDEACSDLNLHDASINRRMELKRDLENITFEREALMSAEPEEGKEFTQEELDARYARIAELRSQEMRLQEELTEIEKKGVPQLTMENVARVIELWTKIPASKIREEEFKRLSELEDRLKQHIVGQDEAVAAVAAAIRRNRVGISPKHKPVSFIFVGSTGVGKTELVKQLADDLFHAPESLIRLDMSEFMEKHSVSRIVGSPPGYVGYDEAGQLTEKIRRKPYSVVLFDEIEKAHPDVLNVLLQILDDGQITDAHGRKVNFENTVIVMTSNAGSDKSAGGTVGFGRSSDEQDKERVMKALQSFLRPEFINRVDEIVYFHQLTKENFAGIARIMLRELTESLSAKGFTFAYDDTLVAYLVDKSYSAAYGARNLRRCIQKELEDPMAVRIIESFDHPITHIRASASGEKVTLETL